ncbi:hypothetical protein E2C01_079756 [Portunus trituberculatus]|uniref:Uncharacterized protein n=1 Tax=Portunus trituberculatus TaxID=210409 RepID=A0A5B7IWG4_PORTR|nr:hypothetical protein [Portunus trituberculatus]
MPGEECRMCVSLFKSTLESHTTASAGHAGYRLVSESSSVKTLTSACRPDPLPMDHPLSSVRSAQQQQRS